MRLYHFTKYENAVDDLQNGWVKISDILDLNDPYELMAVNLSDAVMKTDFLKYRDSIAASRGIICFSTDWSDPIMWSHYGDRHKGVCFGFDVQDGEPFEVQYSDERFSLMEEKLLHGDPQRTLIRILSTKHTPWAYEKEYRLFSDFALERDGKHFRRFDEVMQLREVIVGARALDQLDELSRLCTSAAPNVDVFGTKLSDAEFKIVADN